MTQLGWRTKHYYCLYRSPKYLGPFLSLPLNHSVPFLSFYPEMAIIRLQPHSPHRAMQAQKVIILPLRRHVCFSPFEPLVFHLSASPLPSLISSPPPPDTFSFPFQDLALFVPSPYNNIKKRQEKKYCFPLSPVYFPSLTRDHLSAASTPLPALPPTRSRCPCVANSGQMRSGAFQGFTDRQEHQKRSEIREQ